MDKTADKIVQVIDQAHSTSTGGICGTGTPVSAFNQLIVPQLFLAMYRVQNTLR